MNAAISLLFLPAMMAQSAEGPLTTATPLVERGEVRSGPILSQVYELKNTGSHTLIINEVKIGCGCGRYELPEKRIAPGATIKLTLTLNTLTLPEGPSSWAATVQYVRAGETNRELTVRLKANILREISIDPPVLALTVAGEFTQTITFTDRRKVPTSVSKVVATNTHFGFKLRPTTDEAGVRKQEIVWKVAETLPAGLHEETLLFVTGDPACPELRVPVKVTKRNPNDLEVIPATAKAVILPGEAEASVRVQLRAGGKPIAVLSAESKSPGVSARFSEGSAPVAVVRVIVRPAEAGATGNAEVVVTLVEPNGKQVTIPVSW